MTCHARAASVCARLVISGCCKSILAEILYSPCFPSAMTKRQRGFVKVEDEEEVAKLKAIIHVTSPAHMALPQSVYARIRIKKFPGQM
jgi:hypothetical protein